MDFDIYCDECRPDLLSSNKPSAQYMVIGGVWLPTELREKYKADIHALRDKHKVGGEFKWQKVSPSRYGFYAELIEWFFSQGDQLRYRCIAVEQGKVDLEKYHSNDQELGFYKFYYQLLHHWIFDFNDYAVFCDFKSNRVRTRLHELSRCLNNSNIFSDIVNVQAIRSRESVLIQLADVLTGVASSSLNKSTRSNSAKHDLVAHTEALLGRPIRHTYRSEHKFNVFVIDLNGGW